MSLFDLRAMLPGDEPFIFNSLLKSYRDSPSVSGIPNTLYYKGQHTLLTQLIDRSAVLVACSKDAPDQILGYAIAEPVRGLTVFHWLYVKHTFRGCGVARGLYDALTRGADRVYYTHRPKLGDRLTKNCPALVYNPYLLLGIYPHET